MILRRLIAACLLFMAGPVLAADIRGTWALRSGETTLMLFKVTRSQSGWSGEWIRPAHFESDGDSFSNVSGPAIKRTAKSARAISGGIELIFDDPAPRSSPDVFVIRTLDKSRAEMNYIAFGREPATLVRTSAQTLGGWDKRRTYVRTNDRPTNAEMTAIFEADQADRRHWLTADHKAIEIADNKRRARTQQLLDGGKLQSGNDYYHAAFIFQHGGAPADYLKAHALAVIAAARGKSSATWIAAATLDRYLQSIGQPQIYGTQFSKVGATWSQEPYRKDLLSDALRQATRVPSLAEQEAQRMGFEKEAAMKQ